MADYLFVPQVVLDKWSEQGRVSVDGQVLNLLSEQRSFRLTPAVRFVSMEAGEDASQLLQKVKTTDALKTMGAEQYMDSVILGEVAYKVQQGFLADANALRAAAAAQPSRARPPPPVMKPVSPTPPPPVQQTAEEKAGAEQDLLAQFLLENLQ